MKSTKQLYSAKWIQAIFLVLCMVSRFTAASQTPVEATSFTANGAFFALSVADIEASTKWYTEKLGLKITMQQPAQNKVAVAILEGGGLIVELIQNEEAQPLSSAAPAIKNSILVHGFFKAGVIVDDLDKVITHFKEKNVNIAYGPFPSGANQRANVIIRDNGGNLIQFFGK